MSRWPHAPSHSFCDAGTFMITSGTYHKELIFKQPEELNLLENLLFELAQKNNWKLEAWAIFPNHYHFIAQNIEHPESMQMLLKKFHGVSAIAINKMQNKKGRKVWYQCWDTKLTYPKSYMARLNYVMQNPARHKLVLQASDYNWCSANWFERNATRAYYKSVSNFKIDSLNIIDDFY